MRVLLMTAVLLTLPAAASAHSGTVLKAVVSYFPLALAAAPMLLRLFCRFVQGRRNRDSR